MLVARRSRRGWARPVTKIWVCSKLLQCRHLKSRKISSAVKVVRKHDSPWRLRNATRSIMAYPLLRSLHGPERNDQSACCRTGLDMGLVFSWYCNCALLGLPPLASISVRSSSITLCGDPVRFSGLVNSLREFWPAPNRQTDSALPGHPLFRNISAIR